MVKRLFKIVFLGLLALFLFGKFLESRQTPEQRAELEAKRKADAIKDAASRPDPPPAPAILRVKLDRSDCSLGVSGVVASCKFTISNGNDYDVADPVVTCAFIAGSGTQLASHDVTVYERVRAGGKITTKALPLGLVNGQASSFRCSVAQVSR